MSRALLSESIEDAAWFPEAAIGIDAGLTLTKVALREGDALLLTAWLTRSIGDAVSIVQRGGETPPVAAVTGARAHLIVSTDAVPVAEIDAGARGVSALRALEGEPPAEPFVLALMGTGTAFALVRDEAVTHLGGTAMGGGSFAGIARWFDATLTYEEMIGRASRGDRRKADVMLSDAYPEGIGRLGAGGELTAAHLAKDGGSLDDALAALLNMHGENIAQIAAGRALAAGARRVVIAGGFVHGNQMLTRSMSAMIRMFGLEAEVAPHPGFAGAVGAALLAHEQRRATA